MKILSKEEIEKVIDFEKILKFIEEGFVAYSKKETVIPPVASLHFAKPPGDCHIKYGYSKESKYYVVKIASSFYENPKIGLPSGNGLMLLFDKQTGKPVCLLLDEGYLTDLRTAAAGCIAAKYLAPKNVRCIGIIGTGAQAYYQLKFLTHATECRKVLVWGRDKEKAKKFCQHSDLKIFQCEVAEDLDQLAKSCNLIITTTSSSKPLLFAQQIQPGTHITAMGADDIGKQELDPHLFQKADRIIVDSRSQCVSIGDASHAIQQGLIEEKQLMELGNVILSRSLGRTSDSQITIADLTGVAIQDLQIASAIYSDM